MQKDNSKSLWFGQTKRWYDGIRWRKIAAMHKDENPLCVMCLQRGIETPAYVTDHIVPHNGNAELFFDYSNLQSLCAVCHNIKRKVDNGGVMSGCDIDGNPLDRNHYWNKE